MSVLSRATAPPATSEVAASIAALLNNLDTTAPQTLSATTEAIATLGDDPRLGAMAAAEADSPRRLLGPSGLGASSLRVNLPTPQVITELAGRASRPPSPAGGAVPMPRPPTSPIAEPLRPIPRALGSGRLSTPSAETHTTVRTEPAASRRITNARTGIGGEVPGPLEPARGIPGSTALEPGATTSANPAQAASSRGVTRISRGPSGLGTSSTRRAQGSTIPTLYCPPPVRDNPALAEAVNVGIIAWAEAIGLYEGRLDDLRKADFGRLIMLAHPDCDDADRLLAAAKCAVSEWSVDDYYCEADASDIAPDGSKSSAEAELGPRLELAAAAMDPVHLPSRYQVKVEEALQSDPILRAFRTSFEHLSQFATPPQVARLRTEIAGWFIALGAEAGWRAAGRMPPVWEYLMNRQPHSFLPCMAPIDAVGGYEVPAAEYTDPRVRRVVTTAALAAQMVNDLYSMAREDLSNGREFNLPTVLATEEQCSRPEAVRRTAEVHDELVHRFEAEAGTLAAAGSPELRRFLTGLWAWMGGNRAWHADSRRYNQSS
ncbi:family 2 encapsulin nanocompartment cargo protein terpene cyclase [Nocardia aurantiaca]|uniref:family 2 encapsulin nanocompartment cargo protein terpene cyclase n=1 Tax=Nocardia aurantiaca TaxID=2675850 RepID=UPI001E4520C5|nr:family 2 encapsulin nanocompartment cargo protein terpene cyclase [Nocardia aurantiaca]